MKNDLPPLVESICFSTEKGGTKATDTALLPLTINIDDSHAAGVIAQSDNIDEADQFLSNLPPLEIFISTLDLLDIELITAQYYAEVE